MTVKIKAGIKVIWKILKWLVIATGVLLVLILVVNLDIFDEKLDPGFVQLVESYKSYGTEIPDEQNGMLHGIGDRGVGPLTPPIFSPCPCATRMFETDPFSLVLLPGYAILDLHA